MSVFIGDVQAVGTGQTLVVRHKFPIGGDDFEFNAGKWRSGHTVGLADQKAALRSIGDNHCLRVSVSPDYNVCAGRIHNIARQALDFRQDVCTGGQIGNADFSVAVRFKNAVLCKRGCANYSVQTNLTASGGRHPELYAGERLARDAVPLLDDKLALRLVLEGQRNRPALLDLDCLALGVDQESSGGAGFGNNHALARFQAGNANFSIFIGTINAVAVPDQSAVRIHDFKLGILEGNAGIDAAYLSDKKQAVRGVVEGDGDNILNAVIGDVDRFRGLDDTVSIRRVYFFNDIGPCGEAGPNDGAVLSCYLLPDDGSACSACTA